MRPLHTSTLLTQKPARILSYISELSSQFTGKEYTFLFALSSNFDHPHELEEVVTATRNLRSDKGRGKARMVGCLSGPVSNLELPDGSCAGLSCAVAVFDSRHCIPFYSGLQGRKEAQVGRWHSFRRKAPYDSERLDVLEQRDGQGVNWEDVWNNRASSPAIKGMIPRELASVVPSKIHTLLYMTIPHPDLFTSALSNFLSLSTSNPASLGFVAAPTHFVTGRDITLFDDDEIHGNGTVGLALVKSEDNEQVSPKVATEFIGLRRLGEQMVVTSVEGNMVNSLDGMNPTQHLLRAMERAGISSNYSAPAFREAEQFALAVLNPAGDILRAFRITAGDPTSRGGGISLDAAEAPTQSSVVQFLHRPPNTPIKLPPSLLSSPSSFTYLTVPDSIDDHHPRLNPDGCLLLPNTFLATSTSGFLLSHYCRLTNPNIQDEWWSCSLPGGMVSLSSYNCQ